MKDHKGLPVAGYQPQSKEAVAQVNAHKAMEERLLRVLDQLERKDVDRRFIAIARTHFELGVMALNRSVFKPGRLTNAALEDLERSIPT